MGDIKGNIYLAIFNIADIIENRIGISEEIVNTRSKIQFLYRHSSVIGNKKMKK